MAKNLQESLTRQLHDSVENLQRQAEKVEFWASAVTGLAQPVPEYTPEETAVSRYMKSPRKRRKRKIRDGAAVSANEPEARLNKTCQNETPQD